MYYALLVLRFICCGLLLAAAAPAQGPLKKVQFEGRPGLALSNGQLSITIIPQGGSLAEVVLADDPGRLNPLWNPARMARELGNKPGTGGSLGHFVCVDGFGPVSPEERAAGLPGHGEAHTRPWEVRFAARDGKTITATFSADLPITAERFTRTLRMVDGENVVYVESELESLLGFDRPACWAEHATIGSPFLEPGVTVVDMSAHRAHTRPYQPRPNTLPRRLASDKDFTWPMAPAAKGKKIDLRAAPRQTNSIDHTACLMDPARKLAWVTALHPGRRLILGYIWKREEYPWLQSWENYQPTGKLARGLEFSTQPFDVPRREVVQNNSMFGTPLFRWLPAKSKIGTRFLLFYAHTPEGMTKVDDVRLENSRIVIEDRKAKKQAILPASLPL